MKEQLKFNLIIITVQFDCLIIHVMTGSGWLENIENEVINVLNQD